MEHVSPPVNSGVSWPVANPILTCAEVSDSPSNFVADPFLWIDNATSIWYIFFETKSNRNMQGKGRADVEGWVDDDLGASTIRCFLRN